MPTWVAVLFWIWVLVSLGIFVMRRLSSRRAISTEASSLAGGAAAHSATTDPVDPAAKVWPEPPPPDPDDDTFRVGHDAPPSPSARPEPEAPAPPVTPPSGTAKLPELLEGIRVPNDLVPLTQFAGDVDLATHVILSTTSASAEAVRVGLQGELERLGYSVEHLTMMHLVAAGSRGTILVDIHPDGPGVTDAGVLRFPTAPGGSVVVELRVG